MKYYYDKANLSEMGTELLAMNWDEILSIENINEQWTIFKDIILATRDRNVPKRTGRTLDARKGKTNLDFKTLSTIRKKHRCWKRFMETRDSKRYEEYCKVRNQVRNLTRRPL